MVELQQEAGPAAPPAVRIDVTAAAAVAAPHLAPHRCRNVPGSTRPVGRLRAAPGRAGCLGLRPRMAIELHHPCPLRWRRSAATTIRGCQRGRHAVVCRWCRPWRRCGGVRPTIGRRLRRRSGCVGRSRRWPGTHRGAAAASLAPRRRHGQRCHRRGAGAAAAARGLLWRPRSRRRCAATGARALRRRRHCGLLLRAPLRWRSRPARRPFLRLRLRRLDRACLPAPPSAPAPRSARVVALQAVLHQPLHELPHRQVRVHVRQQCPELLDPALTGSVDHHLQLPAVLAQRPHALSRPRQLGSHRGQQLLHLARALAARQRHQLLPLRLLQRRRRSRWRRCRGPQSPRLRRRPRAARQQLPCRGYRGGVRRGGGSALLEIEGVLQLRRGAQGERAVLQPLA